LNSSNLSINNLPHLINSQYTIAKLMYQKCRRDICIVCILPNVLGCQKFSTRRILRCAR